MYSCAELRSLNKTLDTAALSHSGTVPERGSPHPRAPHDECVTCRDGDRVDRDGRTPYELVTGLLPQGPISSVCQKLSPDTLTATAYVKDLVDHRCRL